METNNQLPATIAKYISTFNSKDIDGFVKTFTKEAVVKDDGKTHEGVKAIRQWQEELHNTFSLHNTVAGFSKNEENNYHVVIYCEGNFPGSPQESVITLHLTAHLFLN